MKRKLVSFRIDDYVVEYFETPELIKAIYDKIIKYYKTHENFSGEGIMQSDDCIIDAPSLLCDIADDLIKFDVTEDSILE